MNFRSIIGFIQYHICYPWIQLPQVLSYYFHNPTPNEFEKVIKWTQKKGYSFVGIPQLLSYMKGEVTPQGRWAIVTFDDAWRSNLDLMPIIEQYQIPVTIFAPVEPLDSGNYWWEYAQKKGGLSLSNQMKSLSEQEFNIQIGRLKMELELERTSMTLDELKEIDKNKFIDVESHSFSHPILTNLSEESLVNELKESKRFLSTWLNKNVRYFCYPNGSLTHREIAKVKEYYDCAFSTMQDVPQVGGDIFTIPRYALTNDYWSNLAKLIGVWKLFKKS